jgi:recombination protein RecA
MNSAAALATTLGVRPALKISEFLPSGLPSLDRIIQGFPRGAISEIAGSESSGRATLAHSLLASSTARLEVCAYVDASDTFDPQSASAAGVSLSQLVWIRCGHDAEHAFKSTDLLLHGGGFGVVVLDLCRVPDRTLRHTPISYWHRFRSVIEKTPTILVLLEREAQAKSCAGLILELTRKNAIWGGAPGFHLLRAVEIEAGCRKPLRPGVANFQAAALG